MSAFDARLPVRAGAVQRRDVYRLIASRERDGGAGRVRVGASLDILAARGGAQRSLPPLEVCVSVDGALDRDPLAWFHASFARARESESFDPCRAALATVDAQGAPHVRFVLVRRVDARGFAFFTNYGSDKAQQLAAAPRAALSYHWESLSKQVRVEGAVERVSDAESDEYFASRPRGSQLAAWASRQSQAIASRADLDRAYSEIEARFAGVESVPRPAFWGGYRVVPTRIEFWLGRDARLHDRWSFTREADAWRMTRLQP